VVDLTCRVLAAMTDTMCNLALRDVVADSVIYCSTDWHSQQHWRSLLFLRFCVWLTPSAYASIFTFCCDTCKFCSEHCLNFGCRTKIISPCFLPLRKESRQIWQDLRWTFISPLFPTPHLSQRNEPEYPSSILVVSVEHCVVEKHFCSDWELVASALVSELISSVLNNFSSRVTHCSNRLSATSVAGKRKGCILCTTNERPWLLPEYKFPFRKP